MTDETRRGAAVPDDVDGDRLDTAVSRLLGLTRNKAAALIQAGAVTVDGVVAIKSTSVHAGQYIELAVESPQAQHVPDPEPIPGLRIIHDDDDIVVVDKPAGVAAHASMGFVGPNVVDGLAAAGYRISTSGAAERQGIVQRLDVGTSGLMVVAKSEYAYTMLKRAFKAREVSKTYHAVVQGYLDPMRGTIDAPIGRHPGSEWKFAVLEGGRASITHYETMEMFRHASLVEVNLETGRTHQIRVHMSAMRHPCVGDLTYGADPVLAKRLGLDRQWLHAHRLGFVHPGTDRLVEFESDYSADLHRALDVLAGG